MQKFLETLTNFINLNFIGESKQLADPDVLKRLTSSVRYDHKQANFYDQHQVVMCKF